VVELPQPVTPVIGTSGNYPVWRNGITDAGVHYFAPPRFRISPMSSAAERRRFEQSLASDEQDRTDEQRQVLRKLRKAEKAEATAAELARKARSAVRGRS
jgi:hypothetical protein